MKDDSTPNDRAQPLSAARLTKLNAFLSELNVSELLWTSSYISGYACGRQHTPGSEPSSGRAANEAGPVASLPVLTILYGTETGNSLKAANIAQQEAEKRGFSVRMHDMRDFQKSDWAAVETLLVIVSTQGEGDPPDGARQVHALLHSKRAPKVGHLAYAVLALGDSSYENFCQTGRDFDLRLERLGAKRVQDRVECDLEFRDSTMEWISDVLNRFSPAEKPPYIEVRESHALPSKPDLTIPQYDCDQPYCAEVLENVCLSGAGSQKQVHHLELSIESSGLKYEPGDALFVAPQNAPENVLELLDALGATGDENIHTLGGELSLAHALTNRYEITRVSRRFLARYAQMTGAEPLLNLLNTSDKKRFLGYANGRYVVDVIREVPHEDVPPADVVTALRPLTARAYSIASSPSATPDEVHLTVALSKYEARGAQAQGVASGWLATRAAEQHRVPVYVEPNHHFRLPADPSVPIIMIGPGTGVAPFRSFVAERKATGAKGKNWLFFGDQHLRTDFLYQSEWLHMRREGTLQRLDVAWSRDGAEKVYVQNRIRENGRELYDWLEQGAHLYVCGDASRMAPDVHHALAGVIGDIGGHAPEESLHYLSDLVRQGRYQRDVY